jgi:putative ABC transport system permease protein
MFKFLPLLWASLQRKRLRTWLTLSSIVVAFLLFGVLQTMRAALTGSAELAGVDRLMTIHKISLIQPLPRSYLNRVLSVDGVRTATALSWFGGVFQEDRNQIAAMAVDPETFFEVYPEYELSDEARAAFAADRTAAIVGEIVAQRFGWKVGDTIPMRSNIYTKSDGGNVWDLKVVGIYTTTNNSDNQGVYFDYDYLNESRSFGRDDIGWIVTRVANPDQSADIARKIDGLFANSSTETKTNTEKAFVQAFANQMGNIGAIVTAVASAVFFTLLLVIANTISQSVRERTNELAVMKTLGFSSFNVTALVLAESLLLTVMGAAIGLGIAALAAQGLAKALAQFFPALGLPPETFVLGGVIAVVLGAIAGALPSAQAWQLRIVDALRRG